MKILRLCPEPIAEFLFLNAGQGVGQFYEDRLPILHGQVDQLPDGLDAIIATADLQGRERFQESPGGDLRLLGEVVPQRLVDDVLPRLKLTDPTRIAALLAGDLYAVPGLDKRGGLGDVTNVWLAFGDCFAWVAGVAGNHDSFGPNPRTRPRFPKRLHYLDGSTAKVDGLRIGGVGGVIGEPSKPFRRTMEDYLKTLESVVDRGVNLLLMHDGPDGVEPQQRGHIPIREQLEVSFSGLVVRGHKHWHQPLAEYDWGMQVLNVDARVVILTT